MKWILIIAITIGNGGVGATAEFNSESACQEARSLLLDVLERPNPTSNRNKEKQIICVPKGEAAEQEGGS